MGNMDIQNILLDAPAYVIATIIPLVFLYVIYSLDLYGTGSFQVILLSFGWGIVAYFLALGLANNFVIPGLEEGGALDPIARSFVGSMEAFFRSGEEYDYFKTFQRWTAPPTEELLKAAILIYLVRRADFTYFVDGAIYGFAIGIGFAIFENYLFIGDSRSVGLAISRVISTNLMHATASALIGIAVGKARFDKTFMQRLPKLLFGIGLAFVLHITFNNVVTRPQFSAFVLPAAIGMAALGVGFIVYNIRLGLAEQKAWIEEKLGAADRVTKDEKELVSNLANVHELLTPIAEQFGTEKAEQCEDFLVLQAKLGILRKTQEKHTDEKLKAQVGEEIEETTARMQAARKAVGAYVMLCLRNIFPDEGNPVWDGLGMMLQAIEESGGLLPGELLKQLSGAQHTAMHILLGQRDGLKFDGVRAAMLTLPPSNHLDDAQLKEGLAGLTKEGYVIQFGEDNPTYKVNIRGESQKVGSAGLFGDLADRTTDKLGLG